MSNLKLKEAINLYKGIQELRASKPVLDFNVWYELGKLFGALKPAVESYELKYNELIDECAEKDKHGKNKMLSLDPPMVSMKYPDKYVEGMKKLQAQIVPVKIVKIDKEEFKDVKMEGTDNMFTLFDHVIK